MKISRFQTTAGSQECFAGKQILTAKAFDFKEFSIILLTILFQMFAPFGQSTAWAQCKPVLTENYSLASASVEASANWSPLQSPGSLATPETEEIPLWGNGMAMQIFSNSLWMQNLPYHFSFSYYAETGITNWHIDFNRNGFIEEGEWVSNPSPSLANKGFNNLRISAKSGQNLNFPGMVLIRDLKINGFFCGGLMAAGAVPMELNYSGITGSLNDIVVTGSITFSNMNAEMGGNAPNFKIQLIRPAERTLCELPVISHPTGIYEGQQNISISYPDSAADIYYTTTGNIPVIGTVFTKLYTGPFQVNETTTVRAIAVKNGFPNSPEMVSYLSISGSPSPVIEPIIFPGSGIFTHSQQVSMSCETDSATIYYTTTGNVPIPGTVFTKVYSEPFMVHSSTQVRAIAMKEGMITSPQAIANITITAPPPVVATPQISPGSGFIDSQQKITITCSTPGATIYYTTNGNVPLLSVWPNSFTKIYTGPFPLTGRGQITIRAVATAPSSLNSAVAVANLLVVNNTLRQAVDNEAEVATEKEIRVFPNPSAGTFNVGIQSDLKENPSYTVLSLDGKEVEKGEFVSGTTSKLELGSLKTGLYLLKIKTETGIKIIRLAKE